MLVERERIDQRERSNNLPFGYHLDWDADLLTLRRADGSFVAAFSARGVDFFEVALTLWEDAD